MSRATSLRIVLLLSVLSGLGGLWGTPAAAHPDHEREYARQAQLAFETGRFLEAAQQFEKAYQESRRVSLLWNVALAYRRQYEIDHEGPNLRRARAVYVNFSELTTKVEEVADAKEQIAAIDEILLHPTAPVSPPMAASAPVSAPVSAPASVSVSAPASVSSPASASVSAPSSASVSARVGAPAAPVVAPAPVPQEALIAAAPAPAADQKARGSKAWVWGVVVGAVVVAGAAVGISAALIPNDAAPPNSAGGSTAVMFP